MLRMTSETSSHSVLSVGATVADTVKPPGPDGSGSRKVASNTVSEPSRRRTASRCSPTTKEKLSSIFITGSVLVIPLTLVAGCGSVASSEPRDGCFDEPAVLVEEYYGRIDAMAQSGYSAEATARVMTLSDAQAAETIQGEIDFFRTAEIVQTGATIVSSVDVVSSVDASPVQVSVELDVSGVSYQKGGGEAVTNIEDPLVETKLSLSQVGGCLVVSHMEVL